MKVLNRSYGYLKKDFLLFYKRKKYLYLFLGIPIVLALFFIFALNPSEYEIRMGVCDYDNSELSRAALANMPNFKYEVLDNVGCIENLKKDIISRKYDLGIYIPAGFEKEIQELRQTHMKVYYDNTDVAFSNLISWKVDLALYGFKRQVIDSLNTELGSKAKSVRSNLDIVLELTSFSPALEKRVVQADKDLKNIEEMDTEFIVNPVWTEKVPTYESQMDKSSGAVYVFPIISLFTILMLAAISVIYDRKNGFLTRVKSSSSGFSYLISKMLFFIFLVAVQFLIVMILFLINGGRYSFSFQNIALLVISVALINCLVGFLVGFLSENEGIAVLFSLIIAFPLMLVSGIFFPVQTLPKIMQYFSMITPLNYQIAYSKSVLLFGQSFNSWWIYATIILFVVCFWLIKKER
jgi:ABC-2 type transport system permease protein